MELLQGFGFVGLVALVWGALSLGATLIIWAALVASKGLRPEAMPRLPVPTERVVEATDDRVPTVFSPVSSHLSQ